MSAEKRTAAIWFILVTILIDVIGLGIIIPVLPRLIQQLNGVDIAKASQIGSWLLFAYAIMQFLFSPIIGGLSDKYGRRPVLLLALAGFGVDYFVQAFSPTLAILFFGRIVAGITGASFTTASAYIADISQPNEKAKNFGMIGAAFGIGFIIGPLLGVVCSSLGKSIGTIWGLDAEIRLPFIAAGLFCFVNLAFGFFVLPESLKPENRRPFDWKRANPVGSLLQIKKYPIVLGLMFSMFLIYLASHAVQSNWSYYTTYKFNWSIKQVGFSLTMFGLFVSLVQGGLIRVAVPKLGENRAVFLGLAMYGLGMALFAISNTELQLYASLIIYCLGGIGGPTLQGIMSNQVPPNAQGELQGAMTSLMSFTSFIGPLIMNNIFYYFTTPAAPFKFPAAPFALAAILIFIAIVLSIPALKRAQKNKVSHQAETIES